MQHVNGRAGVADAWTMVIRRSRGGTDGGDRVMRQWPAFALSQPRFNSHGPQRTRASLATRSVIADLGADASRNHRRPIPSRHVVAGALDCDFWDLVVLSVAGSMESRPHDIL